MKAYFISLFNYDCYANELILKIITDANSPEKPVQLFAHLLAAQQVWLNRCLGLPPAAVELWPALNSKHNDFATQVTANHKKWINYLNGLNEPDFDKIVYY